MHTVTQALIQYFRTHLFAVMMGTASFGVSAAEMNVTLDGKQEVPSVTTMASGTANFILKDDMSLSGSVITKGIKATMAHIHAGIEGTNGSVAVPLTRQGDSEWIVPDGTILTAEQITTLKEGGMYVNVHSDAHKGGEIRGQLK
jgi:hypothetical protein|tara:strand:- start:1628 stop:2059 length:432 start_codon:yes stop_codon:yes gene_type:complete